MTRRSLPGASASSGCGTGPSSTTSTSRTATRPRRFSARPARSADRPGTQEAAGRLPGGLCWSAYLLLVCLPVVRAEVVLLQRDRLARALPERVAIRLVVGGRRVDR